MSTFTLKFFAKLKEQTGTDQIEISVNAVSKLNQLKPYLVSEYPQWAAMFESQLMTAINHDMVTGDQVLKAGDEVALFPPVTGG
jgi:molybdopterin synthase sulfur carrier subunit